MKKLVLAISFFVSLNVSAQILGRNVFKSAHLDNTKLSQIDTLLNDYVKNNWLVGASTIIVKDNQVVYYKGHGYADKATKKTNGR